MNTPFSTRQGPLPSPALHPLERLTRWLSGIPDGLVRLLGRFSIAAVFWKSGQTKIEGLGIDLDVGDTADHHTADLDRRAHLETTDIVEAGK